MRGSRTRRFRSSLGAFAHEEEAESYEEEAEPYGEDATLTAQASAVPLEPRRPRGTLLRSACAVGSFFAAARSAPGGVPRKSREAWARELRALLPVWKSTAGLGRPDQTLKFSSSVKSKSIWLTFGRIDCSH